MKCLTIAALMLLGLVTSGPAADHPPNFVLILADDCTFSDLEIHGGQARTPNLKKLASEGMMFNRCFQAAPMCSPTRHNLYTGLYPVKSGAYPNHTMAYPGVKSIAHYLQSAGYRTHLSGKTHINPKSVFPFEYSGKDSNPDMPGITSFLGECAGNQTPFLLIAASNEPHTPWNKGDPSAYPPDKIHLSAIQVDTPETRKNLARYFAEITFFDSQVGEILANLAARGLSNNTFVIVLSEQGYSLPFAKWTCYDAGVHSACVVRWPGKIQAGNISNAMVEYVDVVPTFLDAAKLPIPNELDGKSFLPVLRGERTVHKNYTYSLQTTRGIMNGPNHYGIRSVRNDRYRYIRNLTPEVKFRNEASRSPIFQSWIDSGEAGNTRAASLTHDYQHRPAEELYDCENDPWNRHNLINDPSLAADINDLRSHLDAWMKSQGDEGQATEMMALTRMPRKQKQE